MSMFSDFEQRKKLDNDFHNMFQVVPNSSISLHFEQKMFHYQQELSLSLPTA